jgi:putative ABC transport system permease protein
MRDFLIAGEVALSVVLLIGAGLMLKSFARLQNVDAGYSADRALTMRFSLPQAQYPENANRAAFWERLLERVRSLPGVTSAGMVNVLPVAGHYSDTVFTIEGRPPLPPGQFMDALNRSADPGYFQAIGIPLKRGRFFRPSERLENSRVMIISERMAKQFFAGEDPIGQKVNLGDNKPYEVVGIVGDVRKQLNIEPEPTMYTPLYAGMWGIGSLVVQGSVPPSSLALPIQKEVAALDPDLPVMNVMTMQELVSVSVSSRRFSLLLLLLFAGLAVTLAAVGLYGVLAYWMTQRTSELGIRVALGASRRELIQMMVLQGLKPTAGGLIVGLGAAALAVPVMRTMLFEVSTLDGQVFAVVAILVCVVGAAASLGPAFRASRVDPMVALRNE